MAKHVTRQAFAADDYRKVVARLNCLQGNAQELTVCHWLPNGETVDGEPDGDYIPAVEEPTIKRMLLQAAEAEERIAERDRIIGLLADCLERTADGHCRNGDRLSCPPCIKDNDCKGFAAVQLLRKVRDWRCGFTVDWDGKKENRA